MKRLSIGLLAVLLLSFVACAKGAPVPAPTTTTAPGQVVPAPPGGRTIPAPTITIPPAPTMRPTPTPSPTPTPAPAPVPPGSGSAYSSDADRMIVRTGQMSLLVDDVLTAIDRITKLTESYKGYVVSSNNWKEGERLRGTISIRVPAGDFGNIMKSLAELAVEVTSQSTSSQDVTEEYVDLTAKLQNLQAAEKQLLLIMEKATKVEDILSVQRELANTRGEIERTKGRMQYLERTSATSLININLEQAKLDVKFTANKTSVKSGEEVRFSAQISGGVTPYSYEWDFGDGNTSTSASPTHAYGAQKSYTVTLKVTDDRRNSDTETRTNYITVIPGWNAGNVAGGAWNGFVVFAQVLASIFIWVGIFSPVWIIGGGVFYWWRRRRGKKA